MIIAIPIDDNRENICVSFGRAPYFLIHNTESGKNDIVDNPAAATEGGAGLKAAQFVVDSGAASSSLSAAVRMRRRCSRQQT